MVERNLKSWKDLVRKRACPEGFMVEGYMVYQTMVYIIQYLPKIDAIINRHRIWDANSIKKFEGENLLGKGGMRKVTCK
jgi:hypothetical protein